MSQKKYELPFLSQFRFGILWTLIDALGSQGLLILFHILYRSSAGPLEHGALSCLHSLLYLAVAITNLGLDHSIAPFLELVSVSRYRFRQLLVVFIIPQLILLVSLSLLFYAYFDRLPTKLSFLAPMVSSYSEQVMQAILISFICESLRKTMRTFLQLSFYFRYTAFIELLGIGINLGGLLLMHFTTTLTFLRSWQMMALSSCVQALALTLCLGKVYRSVPEDATQTITLYKLFTRVSKSRFFTWMLECLNQLYSGNFLVPVCALHFGIESASLMKLLSSISSWVTLITKKALGITSNAILAHLKNRDPETQAAAFQYLGDIFNQAVYGLFIFLVINAGRLVSYGSHMSTTVTWSLLSSVLLVTFFESLFVLYEKWYIFEEDSKTYLLFNGLSVLILYFSIQKVHSPLSILLTIAAIRVATFIMLSFFSFYRWNIRPSFKPNSKTIIGSLIISSVFYLLF